MATKNSATGLDKNTAGALSYVLFQVSGFIFLVLEKDRFVRFHAIQSIITFTVLMFLDFFFGQIHLGGFSNLIELLTFVLYLVLIYKAWQGEEWEVPVLGKITRNVMSKLGK